MGDNAAVPGRMWRLALAALTLVAIAWPAAASASATAGPQLRGTPLRSCPDVGPPATDVGLYKIVARGLVCGRARGILRRWYHDPSQKDSGPAGWRCAVVKRGRFEIRSYCHRNGRLISFSRLLA